MDEKVRKLLEYIRQEVSPDSAFLSPVQTYYVEATGLLDEIAKVWEIEKETIGEIVNGDIV